MAGNLVWTLRQPRYRAIAIFMAGLAVLFSAIGTFEVHRFIEKRQGNGELRANARAAITTLTPSLVPTSAAPRAADIRFRAVRATGEYLTASQQYLSDQQQGGKQGFFVITPLRTTDGVLLVARGFVAATDSEQVPDDVPAPPSGTVTVTGRLYPGQGRGQTFGRDEITTIDPPQQATRLASPTYQAYLALGKGRPGTSGLVTLPEPDLSNPTGGAGSLQLLSYVLQWYLFALLALAAPFLLARNEVKDARKRWLGIDPDSEQFDAPAVPVAAIAAAEGESGVLARRAASEVALANQAAAERAVVLSDRYGRSLGPEGAVVPAGSEAALARRPRFVAPYERAASSAETPHRSTDAYHGSYNDHLWQLALAAGEVPGTSPSDVLPADRDERVAPARAPRIVDVDTPSEPDPSAPASGDDVT